MTVKLTPEYIESLIDDEEYLTQPEIIICKLTVGESVFVGEAHCFDTAVQNVERGRVSAKRNAISRIFDAEAYHLKRERDKLNRANGIHMLPIYQQLRAEGGCLRLMDIITLEDYPHRDEYHFDYVDADGTLKHIVADVDKTDRHIDVQLQKQLNSFIFGLLVTTEEQADGSEKVVDVKVAKPQPPKSIEHLPIVKEVRRVGGDVMLVNIVGERYTIAITNVQGMSHIQYITTNSAFNESIDSQLEREIGLRCLGHEYTPQL